MIKINWWSKCLFQGIFTLRKMYEYYNNVSQNKYLYITIIKSCASHIMPLWTSNRPKQAYSRIFQMTQSGYFLHDLICKSSSFFFLRAFLPCVLNRIFTMASVLYKKITSSLRPKNGFIKCKLCAISVANPVSCILANNVHNVTKKSGVWTLLFLCVFWWPVFNGNILF